MQGTQLDFQILPILDCKVLTILDTSFYSSHQNNANRTIQIISPYDDEPVELDYYKNSYTTFNSNSLKITNVLDFDHLVDLPDGFYTAKMSVCPEDKFWKEKSWYRTCLIECKYDKAFLKLGVNTCDVCYSPEKKKMLERAKLYIMGVKADANNCDLKSANAKYKAADNLLNKIIDCSC